jgi:hypothetical protein
MKIVKFIKGLNKGYEREKLEKYYILFKNARYFEWGKVDGRESPNIGNYMNAYSL